MSKWERGDERVSQCEAIRTDGMRCIAAGGEEVDGRLLCPPHARLAALQSPEEEAPRLPVQV